jgi:predicted MFS family arabinose efflux permease
VIGGFVVSHLNWRWLYFGYLPLCVFAWWRLSLLRPGERHPESLRDTDFAGLALFALGTVCSLYWLVSAGHAFAWGSAESALLVVLGVVLMGALAWHQAHHKAPFLPVDLLRNPGIWRLMVTAALFSAAMFSMVFFLPIYLQLGLGLSASTSGILLLPLSAGTVFGSAFVGSYAARTGEPKVVFAGGLLLGTLALVLLNLFRADPVLIGVFALVAGMGFGTVMPIVQVGSQALAGRARLAAVGALVSVFRAFGAAAGIALVGALLFALLPDVNLRAAHAAGESAVAISRAFMWAFLCAACLAGLAAISAWRMPKLTL